MNSLSHVPPGFRFHPTDEELVDYYLRRKIASRTIDLDVIKDVDLYRIEPWDLQEICSIGTEDQNEWYFFSHKDKKYPTGTRTNRATTAGFWKATGRDKSIYSKHDLIGMRKTLVFYKGRAPNGQKSDWIMHEYRLETDENATPQEEGWVVCRVFKKRTTAVGKMKEYESHIWYEDQVSFMPSSDHLESPKQNPSSSSNSTHNHLSNYHNIPIYPCKKELDHLPSSYQLVPPDQHYFLQHLPLLVQSNSINNNSNIINPNTFLSNSPTFPSSSSLTQEDQIQQITSQDFYNADTHDQLTDWRVLDKFVASQLSHEADH